MSLFGKSYELSLARNYVSSWGVVEAVRELIQNAIDSESPFKYEWEVEEDGSFTLAIVSEFTTLPAEALLLGSTTKADRAEAIGSFGEGFKLALLVLTRAQRPVVCYNGAVVWSPEFVCSKRFGDAEVLSIEETPAKAKNAGLTFVIRGLTEDERDRITDSSLQMQRVLGEIDTTSKGQILRSSHRAGKLYVGGLYICETKLMFGYNIDPRLIKLERDRQTVSDFDLKWLVKDMWFETNHWAQIAQMIADRAPDMEHADYGTPELVKEECYRLFRETHPGKLVATSQAELKTMIAQGMTKTVYVGDVYGSNVRRSRGYQEEIARRGGLLKPATPEERLTAWFAVNKRHIHIDSQRTFKDLLKESKNWRNA